MIKAPTARNGLLQNPSPTGGGGPRSGSEGARRNDLPRLFERSPSASTLKRERPSRWEGGAQSISKCQSRTPGRLAYVTFLLALPLLALAGCGYSTAELFPEQYSSVAIPIFENRTFYRGVEYDLTEAVIKEVQQRTPYRIVASTAADTLLTATVVGMDKSQLSRTPAGGLPQEVEVTLTVDFEWKDQRTGETLMTRNGFSAVGRYIPAQPIGEPFEVGQHAAVQRLARDLVSAMRGDW